jgi:hypothetical protein
VVDDRVIRPFAPTCRIGASVLTALAALIVFVACIPVSTSRAYAYDEQGRNVCMRGVATTAASDDSLDTGRPQAVALAASLPIVHAGVATEEADTAIFRGVADDHHAFSDALQGTAQPGDPLGHADVALHNQGFTTGSSLTSWSTDRAVAVQFAGKGGVVLETTIGELQARGITVLPSPDAFGEAEVLVDGVVTNVKVTNP